MTQVIIIVREPKKTKINFSETYDLPVIPRSGEFISLFSNDIGDGSFDLIVRDVWWHLQKKDGNNGGLQDIMVECDIADGPYASKSWSAVVNAAKAQGAEVVAMPFSRIALAKT